ncbi:bromodomain associated domain-containing protein [Coccidioides immitis H538.4]|uniref:Bromodomain associated domain-containing protein n=1 Tax=Coccidioides immitis H538.4 TaxID=396776 RepID=A0A0J8UMR0_COCIT|nr:bromodomain associated domain-containing protein [Coccidioides immitis H538.4]
MTSGPVWSSEWIKVSGRPSRSIVPMMQRGDGANFCFSRTEHIKPGIWCGDWAAGVVIVRDPAERDSHSVLIVVILVNGGITGVKAKLMKDDFSSSLITHITSSEMSTPDLHHCFLRPPIIQILRAAGFHSARPAVIDTLTDIAGRYLLLLASSTVDHTLNSHSEDPVPTLDDVLMAFNDVGALRPQKTRLEEVHEGKEDMRGLESFLTWFSGPANTEIRRIAGFIPSEGDVVDVESMGKEDYLTG